MSNYDSEKLLKVLSEKWRSKGCPMCEENHWGVSNKAMELREFNNGDLVIGGTLQPVIPVNCQNCGYTILVNGLITGVVERAEHNEEHESE